LLHLDAFCYTSLTMNKLDRYKQYNRNRKITAINFNPNKAALLFKVIPFLLHVNYHDLPGYVANPKCPFGIHRFQADEVVEPELFKRFFPTSSARNPNTQNPFTETPCIYSLKTIGSIGTIAQTEKSDCDYWVSIRSNEIGPQGLLLLEQKCKAIEEWALARGSEVYFFLMDIEQTRENSFESQTGEESAGSAIKALLKDELFRTHILVAGKMLLWWLIPPGLTEEQYHRYVNELSDQKLIDPDEFIDLGYLSDIPKSEIFGACLWQMNKALDSPFKSIIKFAYLELLLQEESKTLLLFSDTVKRLVTFPETLPATSSEVLDIVDVDPYLLLAKEIVAFYQQHETEEQRAELIRECLFLKTLEGMEIQKKKSGKRQGFERTITLMENWNLLPINSRHFINIHAWEYRELLEFGAKVHDYLIETYKRLRQIKNTIEDETGVTITQRDIAVLGRKLFTYYEKKTNKIEYLKSLSREAMGQSDITFTFVRQGETDFYYAFQGQHESISQKQQACLITRRDDLVTMIGWLQINGILNDRTRLHLTKEFLPVDLVDIQNLAKMMLTTFPPVNFSKISADQLLKNETITRALAVVNINKTPIKDPKNIPSTLITANSYGEYFYQHFTTALQLKNALRLLLAQHFVSRWNNNLEIYIPAQKDHHLIKGIVSK